MTHSSICYDVMHSVIRCQIKSVMSTVGHESIVDLCFRTIFIVEIKQRANSEAGGRVTEIVITSPGDCKCKG